MPDLVRSSPNGLSDNRAHTSALRRAPHLDDLKWLHKREEGLYSSDVDTTLVELHPSGPVAFLEWKQERGQPGREWEEDVTFTQHQLLDCLRPLAPVYVVTFVVVETADEDFPHGRPLPWTVRQYLAWDGGPSGREAAWLAGPRTALGGWAGYYAWERRLRRRYHAAGGGAGWHRRIESKGVENDAR
jgi:hypothetical protein